VPGGCTHSGVAGGPHQGSGGSHEVEEGSVVSARKKKKVQGRRTGADKVIFHAQVSSIQCGLLAWRATLAKVVKMYPKHNIADVKIFATVRVTIRE
jgi:hypothetical protein